MRIFPLRLWLAAALALTAAGAAHAQSIGVVAPMNDAVALLGRQMRQGAEVAAASRGVATQNLHFVDSQCTAEGGAAAARELVSAGVQVVVGFLCTEAIEAALPILKEAGIPTITPGVRTDSLTERRDRTGWLVFRTAPRAGDEEEAAAAYLVPRWSDALFALVDDGTIYGREFVESFRLAAEMAGLKAVFVDTYRPQMDNQVGLVARLRRAGATHVLVGGDLADVAIMGRDAAGLDYDLTIAAGETLRAAPGDVPLATGTLMVGLPEPAEIASAEALSAFAERGVVPEGYALPTFAAFEIAAEALVEAETSGRSVAEVLGSRSFETALGTIAFDDKGDLAQNPYRLFRYDGQKFVEVE
jgi:branched-chain amino acid transport system substrate-binding protein